MSNKEKYQIAIQLVIAGEGKVKILKAMTMAGFTAEQRLSMTIYQRVRRAAQEYGEQGKPTTFVTIPPTTPTISISSMSSSSSNNNTASSATGASSPESSAPPLSAQQEATV